MAKRNGIVGTVGLVLGLALAGLAGCGGDAGAGGQGGSGAGNGKQGDAGASASRDGGGAAAPDYSKLVGWVSFHPSGAAKTYNSGFDGTNAYVVPMTFFASEKPTVTFGDPSAAELNGIITLTKSLVPNIPAALDGKIQLVLVKTKKAGQTTMRGVAGAVDQTATLKITQYTPADGAAGEARYNQGNPSCNGCHAETSVHNPGLLADLSDETILGIALEGKSIQRINPQTTEVETVQPNAGNHKWQATTAEGKGLVAYLRSRDLQFQLSGIGVGR